MKNRVWDKKYTGLGLFEIRNRLDITEEKVSGLDDTIIKLSKMKHTEKWQCCGTSDDLMYVTGTSEGEEQKKYLKK